MTVIVNFFAGPGAGKSTTKAGLFFEMKHAGFKVESVDEFAKELTYDGAFDAMENEMWMLAEQDRRLRRLVGKVDFVLTDAPLLKSLFYVRGIYDNPAYKAHIQMLFDSYVNFNVWVRRTKPYMMYGRAQTECEADEIGRRMKEAVGCILDVEVDGDRRAPVHVLEALRSSGLVMTIERVLRPDEGYVHPVVECVFFWPECPGALVQRERFPFTVLDFAQGE